MQESKYVDMERAIEGVTYALAEIADFRLTAIDDVRPAFTAAREWRKKLKELDEELSEALDLAVERFSFGVQEEA